MQTFMFEISTLDGEFSVEIQEKTLGLAIAKLRREYPEMTGWHFSG